MNLRLFRSVAAAALLALLVSLGAAQLARAGSPFGPRFLIRNASSVVETESSIAYNSQDQEYLVVWQAESAGPVKEVWGQRLSRDRALLGSAFRISPANGGYNPDVTYDSAANQYMVVYEVGGNICGQFVSNTGGLVGSEIKIAAAYVHGAYHYHSPAVAYASTSDRYLVVFQYVWDLDGSTAIDARAYLSDGTPEDYAFEVGPYSATTFPDSPDVAYNQSRNEFLVAWHQTWTSTDHDIYARRVQMTGGAAVQGNAFYITASVNDDLYPAVAAISAGTDEGRYLVAWESSNDVRAMPVSGTGTLGTLRVVAGTAWSEYRAAVAGCESNQQFLVVWTWVPSPAPPAMMQVQGRMLALDGALLGAGTTDVGGGQVYESAVAAGPIGDFLITFDDNATFGTSNRGIYGWMWGDRVYLPLVMRET
jgi:hypothetical protein